MVQLKERGKANVQGKQIFIYTTKSEIHLDSKVPIINNKTGLKTTNKTKCPFQLIAILIEKFNKVQSKVSYRPCPSKSI